MNSLGHRCHYHSDDYLLQNFSIEQLRGLIAKKQRWLTKCEKEPREMMDEIWPLRRQIRQLGKTLARYLRWVERNGFRVKTKPEGSETRKAA